jgi:hypothetical protein
VIGQKPEPELNLDRMVPSATAGSAGEPYCELIVDCLWQTQTWLGMSLADIESFWQEAAASNLTVEQFITAKRDQFA